MGGYMNWLTQSTPAAWWIDSIDPDDVSAALSLGAEGITTNPMLVRMGFSAKPDYWRGVIGALPNGLSADDKAREIMKRMVTHAAGWALPIYERTDGVEGYICCQVNPALCGDADAMLAEARLITAYAPNISVKLPVCRAGLIALEECVALGMATTATVSFAVAQTVAIAEAYERGARRAKASGIAPRHCNAVVMIGRLEDYLMLAARDNGLPELCADIPQAGVLVTKRAAAIFAERGFEAPLLPSGVRAAHQIQALAGIAGRFSVAPKFASELEAADAPQANRFDEPVDAALLGRLRRLPEFCRAYEPDGMSLSEFVGFGSFQRTIMQFCDIGWNMIGGFDV